MCVGRKGDENSRKAENQKNKSLCSLLCCEVDNISFSLYCIVPFVDEVTCISGCYHFCYVLLLSIVELMFEGLVVYEPGMIWYQFVFFFVIVRIVILLDIILPFSPVPSLHMPVLLCEIHLGYWGLSNLWLGHVTKELYYSWSVPFLVFALVLVYGL